jgi:hypothetical protein
MIPSPIFTAIIGLLFGISVGYGLDHRACLAEVAKIRADTARCEATATDKSSLCIEAASNAIKCQYDSSNVLECAVACKSVPLAMMREPPQLIETQ